MTSRVDACGMVIYEASDVKVTASDVKEVCDPIIPGAVLDTLE